MLEQVQVELRFLFAEAEADDPRDELTTGIHQL
jgi:hypothetical protein